MSKRAKTAFIYIQFFYSKREKMFIYIEMFNKIPSIYIISLIIIKYSTPFITHTAREMFARKLRNISCLYGYDLIK